MGKPVGLKIPYHSQYNFIDCETSNYHRGNFTVLYLMVLNPLIAATGGTTNLNISVWLTLSNIVVRVPRVFTAEAPNWCDLLPTPTQQNRPVEDSEVTADELHMASFLRSLPIQNPLMNSAYIRTSLASETGRAEGWFDGFVSGLTKVVRTGISIGNTIGKIAKGVETFAPLVLDKPRALDYSIHNQIVTVSEVAHGDGKDTSSRLSLYEKSCHVVYADNVGHLGNEMNFLHIVKTPMLVATTTWSTTSAVDSVLFTTLVTPLLAGNTGTTVSVQPTYLFWVAKAFTYWRGSINFSFDVVSTTFHAGRLRAYFIPGADPTDTHTSTAGDEPSSTWPSVYFDVKEADTFKISCPYTLTTTMARVHDPTLSPSGGITQTPTVTQTRFTYIPSISGRLYIKVLNALQAPGNLPTTVDVNIWVSGGDDMEFSQTYALDARGPVIFDVTATGAAQGGPEDIQTTSDRIAQDTAYMHFGRVPVKEILPMHFIGENPTDVRDVIKRYSMINLTAVTIGGTATLPLRLSVTPCVAPDTRSFVGHFSRIFAGWSGALRYKVLLNTSKAQPISMTGGHFPDWNEGGFVTAYNITQQQEYSLSSFPFKPINVSHEPALQVEVAYQSPFPLLRTTMEYSDVGKTLAVYPLLTNGNLSIWLDNDSGETQEFELHVYMAAGDDFSFHHLVPPPPIVTAATPNAYPYQLFALGQF